MLTIYTLNFLQHLIEKCWQTWNIKYMVKIEKTKTLNEETKWKTTKLIVYLHNYHSTWSSIFWCSTSFFSFLRNVFYHCAWEEYKFFEGVWQICFLMTQQAPLFWAAFGLLELLWLRSYQTNCIYPASSPRVSWKSDPASSWRNQSGYILLNGIFSLGHWERTPSQKCRHL